MLSFAGAGQSPNDGGPEPGGRYDSGKGRAAAGGAQRQELRAVSRIHETHS